ncbi:hypothetical protein [Mastigocladopsis repens]|uniref:hypothetical protein n=1 Tax=Mastigocladopsis repens TaxID=221287 RepID=UPI0002F737F3|nr:hypothetical protein [Mastigocladopsis repens]
MSLLNAAKPWAVFRCLSYNVCVARFRKRSDAEGYASILRQNNPNAVFQVVFDLEPIKSNKEPHD